ncbi:MAG TPA: hypothetical protein VJ965_07555 [Anaerolineales bacterium]|nr:hypothetical protein [Anaerolineales bacterium]
MEKEIHPWLRPIHVYHYPGTETPLIQETMKKLLASFETHGHTLQTEPGKDTDVLLTSARFGELLSWRRALMFTGRIKFKLDHTPRTITLVHMTPDEFKDMLAHFEQALAKEPFDRSQFVFEGLADAAPDVLVEQGRRGGPMLSLIRLLQSQLKCIRILLLVGEDQPEKVYHIDLVGAHPYSDYEALGEDAFYEDIVLRTATYESTYEVTKHEVVGDLIPSDVWEELPAVAAMTRAGQEMGKRKFFTDMLRIVDLVPVPGLNDAIADQYSEGCFATWDPRLPALITTVTGSARPVDKGNITPNDLAAITGIRPNRMGAQVRHVEGGENISPSSEAVELIDMDTVLHTVEVPGLEEKVPVVRSKLHGHRGVGAFDPAHVEFVPMDSPYHNYLVSCATEAQARGIKAAFSRAQSLQDPDDPRRVAFTVLPGHGIVITEKWANGKQPFELIWEYMDAGYLKIDRLVPQGMFMFDKDHDGLMKIIQ